MSNPAERVPAQRILWMEESETLKMAQKARDLTAQGHRVINLSLGEPDFDTPEHIKRAAIEAMEAGFTKYTPVAGFLDLREAICKKLARDNNLHFKPSQVVVSNGSKQCFANICMALLDPGDEAIVISPYWVSYREIIKIAGGVPVFVHAGVEDDFKISNTQLKDAITSKTKLLIFSSPCNPTGAVFSQKELEMLAEVLAPHPNVVIVSDEIYEYINFTGKHVSIGAIESVKDRVITINGFAKGFSMTGWRLGYMAGPQWAMDACIKVQGQFTSGAAAFSQKAGKVALESSLKPTQTMCTAFRERRDALYEQLSVIPGLVCNKPEGAFYLFPKVDTYFGKKYKGSVINSSDDLCDYLLNEAHIATVPGTAFGDPTCIRISYANSMELLLEAAQRMKVALAALV